MNNTTIIINPDLSTELAQLPEGSSLDFLQGKVGGLIQYLPFPVAGVDAYVNDEGKILDLYPNWLATCAMQKAGYLFEGDWIAGSMVLAACDDEGNTVGLSPEQMQEVGKVLGDGMS